MMEPTEIKKAIDEFLAKLQAGVKKPVPEKEPKPAKKFKLGKTYAQEKPPEITNYESKKPVTGLSEEELKEIKAEALAVKKMVEGETAKEAWAEEPSVPPEVPTVADYTEFLEKMAQIYPLFVEAADFPVPDGPITIWKNNDGKYECSLMGPTHSLMGPTQMSWQALLPSVSAPILPSTIEVKLSLDQSVIDALNFLMTAINQIALQSSQPAKKKITKKTTKKGKKKSV